MSKPDSQVTSPIRIETLAWAIRRLPPAEDEGPREVSIPVHKYRMVVDAPPSERAELQNLIFRREVFGYGERRWHEWTFVGAA